MGPDPDPAPEGAASVLPEAADTSAQDADTGTPYPSHWEADVVLRDGGTGHLRPIGPRDSDALQRFHLAQSAESIYLRFFAPMPRLSDRDLYRFTHVDHRDRVAFVITVGGQIIGIGRYDRVAPTTAEVAFNIADAHHGRGVGSVLLEHLAAVARENGVHRFIAEVLPQNRKMMAVFRDAGYEVRHRYEDGVISLGFDIDPTEKSIAVMESREHRAESLSVRALLNPSSVVLIGASRRPGTVGHTLLTQVKSSGFTGALHVVHPEADRVLDVPAFRRIGDVPAPVDLAVVAVPAPAVLEVVEECAAAGVRGLIVCSGGFSETGPVGHERQLELVRVAREHGMRVIGPNSWGVVNADPGVRLNVSLRPFPSQVGRLGLFCQSGALSVAVLDAVERHHLGVSTFVSAGNRADVSGNDCMQYWEADERTDAVGLYLESMGNPRKFQRIARRLSRSKPVIVLRSGTSGFGVPPGHTVRASTAPREAFDAMLSQTGCIHVENLHQLFGVAQVVLNQPLPAGDRVGVVANSVALGALLADVCTGQGLIVVHGPVAVPDVATPAEFRDALETCLDTADVDALVAAYVPPVAGQADEIADCIAECAASARQPVVACLIGMDGIGLHDLARLPRSSSRAAPADAAGSAEGGRQYRVPVFGTPEEAVSALAQVVRYAVWRRRDSGTRVDPPGRDSKAAAAMVEQWLLEHPEGLDLDDQQAAALLACYGIELWPSVPVRGPQDAAEVGEQVGFPVALKTTAEHFRHRVDLGGVRLDIEDGDELAKHVEAMQERLAPLGAADLVVQRMAATGVACVVRTMEDPLFGPVVSFGLGGDASDLLGDVAYRIAPLTDVDVGDLVRSVRAAPKLFGHRGADPVDVAALEDLIARLSCLADELPEVADVELNPVVVSTSGLAALSAAISVRPVLDRTDGERRRLSSYD